MEVSIYTVKHQCVHIKTTSLREVVLFSVMGQIANGSKTLTQCVVGYYYSYQSLACNTIYKIKMF